MKLLVASGFVEEECLVRGRPAAKTLKKIQKADRKLISKKIDSFAKKLPNQRKIVSYFA